MDSSILFAIIAAIAFGVWTVFHQQASHYIDNLFGAIIVSLTAVIIGGIILLPKIKSTILYNNPKGLIFAALAGICALGIDFFVLKSYSTGLPISIGGPIIIGGSVAIASIIGFFLGESITLLKVAGLIFVILGSAILSAASG